MTKLYSNFACKIATKLVKKPKISLIICSHNRANILDQSLAKYLQINTDVDFEILVILNACTDSSLQVVRKHIEQLPQLRFLVEETVGLSYARNTGYKNAMADFVFFVDDDAYIFSGLIDHLHQRMKDINLRCISGRTIYWPQDSASWIKASYVEVPRFRKDFGELPDRGYLNGCACGFDVSLLERIGGFDPQLGMKGKNLGYFEEVAVMNKIKDQNIKIYYDPYLIVYHRSHFKTAKEFINSAYYRGKFETRLYRESTLKLLLKWAIYSFIGLLKFPIIAIQKGWNSAIVESFFIPASFLGKLLR